jgi:hypothetical protein
MFDAVASRNAFMRPPKIWPSPLHGDVAETEETSISGAAPPRPFGALHFATRWCRNCGANVGKRSPYTVDKRLRNALAVNGNSRGVAHLR